MGIGKNMKCKCSKCAALSAATDAYRKVVKLYMQCALDLWDHRCDRWVDYKAANYIESPNIGSSAGMGTDYSYHEAWETSWGGVDGVGEDVGELDSEEEDEIGEGSWVSPQSAKYVLRQQELNEYDRLTRLYCGYSPKPSKREREGAIRNEAGRSHSIMHYLTSNGDMEDSDVMELKTLIDDNVHLVYADKCGCDDHDLQPDDRVDDILDIEGCDFCKELYLGAEHDARIELNLPIIRSVRRRTTESNIDFNDVPQVRSLLTLQFSWLSPNHQNQIRKRAKESRRCGHKGRNKRCSTCDLAQLHAQYQWEVDNGSKRRKYLKDNSFRDS